MARLNKQQIAELISALEDMENDDLLALSHAAAARYAKKTAMKEVGTLAPWEVVSSLAAISYVKIIQGMNHPDH